MTGNAIGFVYTPLTESFPLCTRRPVMKFFKLIYPTHYQRVVELAWALGTAFAPTSRAAAPPEVGSTSLLSNNHAESAFMFESPGALAGRFGAWPCGNFRADGRTARGVVGFYLQHSTLLIPTRFNL